MAWGGDTAYSPNPVGEKYIDDEGLECQKIE